ncbi:MAG TPA: sensor domain-containing diguanylate cyclase [Nannocystis exedens]|nr:sensor domain-containing diguanylate cyclase [Nannocystis exedens]
MTSHAGARALYTLRTQATHYWGMIVIGGVWLLLAAGGPKRGGIVLAVLLTAYAATLLRGLHRALYPPLRHSTRKRLAEEVELGLLLLTAVYLLVAITGGPRSYLYPLVYALVSLLTVVHTRKGVAITWIAAIVALEIISSYAHAPGRAQAIITYHLSFIAFFAAGNLLILGGFVRRLRADHRRKVDAEIARMRSEARNFRLVASKAPLANRTRGREDEELQIAQGAVETIQEQQKHQVTLLRNALGLHSCAILWRSDETPSGLTLEAISSASDELVLEPELESASVLAGMLKNPRPLRLKGLQGKRVPPYYRAPVAITDLCALPIREGDELCGILCADRNDDRPFDSADESLLTNAAQQIGRLVAHERVFATLERSRYEQEQFYRASELLGSALTPGDVYAKTFAAIQAIRPYDLAVISSYDAHAHHHRVLAVDGPGADNAEHGRAWADLAGRLDGLVFEDGMGLVAIAVKNRLPMPARGDRIEGDAVVFTPRTRLSRARSLLILPLVHGEQILGAITLASSREQAFPNETREMLRVISYQVAVSLQNARMYSSMEERATTDGLTGLTNHRSFQERFAGLHALAERRGGKVSVILTDIDHFKRINDTYGHPVGDAVLRRVAAIFSGRSRKVDIVARYGGEEFVLVLPDTDARGAEIFANKLREEIGAQTMTAEQGQFQITISMGVAEYPSDGLSCSELIERADQALYYCKHNGRNCVVRWSASKGSGA